MSLFVAFSFLAPDGLFLARFCLWRKSQTDTDWPYTTFDFISVLSRLRPQQFVLSQRVP